MRVERAALAAVMVLALAVSASQSGHCQEQSAWPRQASVDSAATLEAPSLLNSHFDPRIRVDRGVQLVADNPTANPPAATPNAHPGGVTPALFSAPGESPPPTEATLVNWESADDELVSEPIDLKKQFTTWLEESKKNTYPNLTVNGVFQADAGFFSQEAESVLVHGDLEDGASFRRARLSAKGAVTETVNYMMQFDFAFFGRPTFTDLWVEQTKMPLLGNLRFGQWKQPFSLEVVSSFRYTTFLERSLLFQPFTPFRHLGAGFYNHSEDLNWTWAASGFRSGQDQFGGSISDDGGWGTSERITHLPCYDESSGGRYYLHLGFGHYFANPPRDTYNFRTIPEFYVGENANGDVGTSGQAEPGVFNGVPFFVATGPLNLSSFNVFGTELLWVHGPWSFQTETMISSVDQISNPGAVLYGSYAQVGYFLTGEHRPYDRANGAIDRVQPYRNFVRTWSKDCAPPGCGAWEIAMRWSYIDLTDENIVGGELTDLTLGLNWYWNPYTKLVWNYIHAAHDPVGGPGNDTDIFGMRAQVDF